MAQHIEKPKKKKRSKVQASYRRIQLQRLFEANGFTYQEFTESEDACISDKISEVINSGEAESQEQAIAIAISSCAPDKALSAGVPASMIYKDESSAVIDPIQTEIEFYECEQDAETGTWTVRDVPFFAAHNVRGRDGKIIKKIDDDWIIRSYQLGHTRNAGDYYAPLHVEHHEFPGLNPNVEYAGKWRFSDVRKALYDGKPLTVGFCDYLEVPEKIFQRMLIGELDYRSVEILNVDTHEIDSLSVLSHETPFFRFPNLSRRIDKQQVASARRLDADEVPLIASRTVGKGELSLFYFAKGYNMITEQMPEKKVKRQEEEEEKEEESGNTGHEDENDENGNTGNAEMMEALNEIKDMIGSLVEAITGEEAEPSAEEDEEAQEEAARNTEETPVFDLAAKHAEALKGSDPALLAALRTTQKDVKELVVDKVLLKASKDLAQYGMDDEETVKDLKKIHETLGVKGVDNYIAAIKKHAEKDPPPNWTGEIDNMTDMDPTVEKFAKYGKERLTSALKYGKEYDSLNASVGLEVTKEVYINDQFESENVELKA